MEPVILDLVSGERFVDSVLVYDSSDCIAKAKC